MTEARELSSQFPSIQFDPLTCIFHPKSEEEIIQLVQHASSNSLQVRVIGSGHSVQESILSTAQGAINISLDQYRKVTFNEDGTVTVQAGCYLGQHAPEKWENTLFYQLDQKGLAAPDMGGITHQAVGGFTTMGCAGGSVQYAYTDSIVAISFVDGQGVVHSYRQGKDSEFEAVLVSMGLMGIVSTLTFKPDERFNIIGDETCYALDDVNCPIDFFGSGTPGRPSLEQFLRQTEYTRLLWWPQKGAERIVIWKARRMEAADYNGITGPPENFQPKPYLEFPVILGSQIPAQVAASLFYQLSAGWPTLVENWIPEGLLRDLVEAIIEETYETYILPFVINLFAPVYNRDVVTSEPYPSLPCPFGNLFSDEVRVVELGRNTDSNPMQGTASLGSSGRRAAGGPVLRLLPPGAGTMTDATRVTSIPIDLWNDVLARMPPGVNPHLSKLESALSERGLKLPRYYHIHVPSEVLQGLEVGSRAASQDPVGTQNFWDNWYSSLPMDNDVSDFLMPTEFTELWIPIEKTQEVMNKLRDFYEKGGFKATGSFSCEIYSGKADDLWLSPAYKQDVVRVDVFWFHDLFRSEDELKAFYQQYWELLREYDFRPHWAKYLPEGDMGPAYLAQRYPMWKQFLELRARRDPKQLFVTDYWRNALGIPKANS
ncbi:D-arabinono-1,4-lactone oxidase [Archangium sp.]|uniref:D-arabinono-1,4-lactone oxidase n=1 Tax=Archangium sp. TaxID=1872627 RepID=UPI002D344CAB|nr:D-arabinono-1,4-lactone oxidase [Archangium sp.]HYO57097.1 D-arabinono-1,4-lactone oxidase [Archangium sp.]